jgi:hypothetical protein
VKYDSYDFIYTKSENIAYIAVVIAVMYSSIQRTTAPNMTFQPLRCTMCSSTTFGSGCAVEREYRTFSTWNTSVQQGGIDGSIEDRSTLPCREPKEMAMECPMCGEEIYNVYECGNCGYDCEDDLPVVAQTLGQENQSGDQE